MSSVVGTWYRVRGRAEECECAECGYPLYRGDRAIETPEGDVVCSRTCERWAAGIEYGSEDRRDRWLAREERHAPSIGGDAS